MAPNTAASFNTMRARAYVFRLPLFTRAVIVIIALLGVLSLVPLWDLQRWGSLIPSQVSIYNSYRITTFPLIHLNLVHAFLNILALTPLLERFELEYGSLTTLALFFGPLTSIPSVIYLVIDGAILGFDTPVMGASLWVFLLLSWESIKTYQSNPHIIIGSVRVPTWTMPLVMVLVVAALIPRTSIIGHLCGVGIGYLLGLGYLKFLSPPEWALRWVENRFNLLARLPHYVSFDQKTYGRFGVLPSANQGPRSAPTLLSTLNA